MARNWMADLFYIPPSGGKPKRKKKVEEKMARKRTRQLVKVQHTETETIIRYRHRLLLECGHVQLRNGSKTPKSVECYACCAPNEADYYRWKNSVPWNFRKEESN